MTVWALAPVFPALANPEGFAWAPPRRPEASPVDCPRAYDLVPGRPVPPDLLDEDSLVRCAAVVVPPPDAAHLLLYGAWSEQAVSRGLRGELRLSVAQERVEALRAELDEPTPWSQRPATQRTLGRVEMVVAVALVGALIIGLDRAVDAP